MNLVKIQGTPVKYSVAPGRRPVNPFQIEAAVNFRNNNGRRLQRLGARNSVGEVIARARTIRARCYGGGTIERL
jgi:hypothetical protein